MADLGGEPLLRLKSFRLPFPRTQFRVSVGYFWHFLFALLPSFGIPAWKRGCWEDRKYYYVLEQINVMGKCQLSSADSNQNGQQMGLIKFLSI